MWQIKKNLILTKIKNSNCDCLKTQIVTKLKKFKWDISKIKLWKILFFGKLKKSSCDKTQKLKLWQNPNCDKAQKLKLWQNLRTQMAI